MSYAINAQGTGWRAVNSEDDLLPGETYSETQPELSVAAPIPPVSARQIRQALSRQNLRSQVEAAVAAGDQDLKDWWEFSTVIERNHPEVTAMAAALNISDTAVDALFALAVTL